MCDRFHPTKPARQMISKVAGIPYYPKNYFFALYGATELLAKSPDDRLTSAPRFTKVRTLCEMEVLKKIKAQAMAVPVTVLEGKQTISLVKEMSKDVAMTVLHIARGISNPRSLIKHFNDVIDRYGFRKRPPISKKRKTLRRFHNAMYDAFKRKKIKYPSPTMASDVSSRWLQYRYGVVPLMSDIEALHDIFYVDSLKPVTSSLISARYRHKGEYPVGGTGNDGLNIMFVQGTSKTVSEVKLYFKNKRHEAITSKRLGTSLRDMPSTLWEIIPFSFVIDWFIDLGDYFSALSASHGLEFVTGYFATKEVIEDDTFFSTTITGQVTPPVQFGEDEIAKRKYGVFNRTVYSSFPTPSLPSFTFPFDSLKDKRLADTISLFVQMRRKGEIVN